MTSPRINLILLSGAVLMYTFCILLVINPNSTSLNQIKSQVLLACIYVGGSMELTHMYV